MSSDVENPPAGGGGVQDPDWGAGRQGWRLSSVEDRRRGGEVRCGRGGRRLVRRVGVFTGPYPDRPRADSGRRRHVLAGPVADDDEEVRRYAEQFRGPAQAVRTRFAGCPAAQLVGYHDRVEGVGDAGRRELGPLDGRVAVGHARQRVPGAQRGQRGPGAGEDGQPPGPVPDERGHQRRYQFGGALRRYPADSQRAVDGAAPVGAGAQLRAQRPGDGRPVEADGGARPAHRPGRAVEVRRLREHGVVEVHHHGLRGRAREHQLRAHGREPSVKSGSASSSRRLVAGSARIAATCRPVVPSPYGQGRPATRASSSGALSRRAAARPSYGTGPDSWTPGSAASRPSSPYSRNRRAVRGCTGKRTGPSSAPSAATRFTRRASRSGSSTLLARWAVTRMPVRRCGGTGARPRSCSASMTGLPTTKTRSAGTPSAARNAAARGVGAKCSCAVAAATRRLTSSTLRSLKLRSPASTWAKGRPAARAA